MQLSLTPRGTAPSMFCWLGCTTRGHGSVQGMQLRPGHTELQRTFELSAALGIFLKGFLCHPFGCHSGQPLSQAATLPHTEQCFKSSWSCWPCTACKGTWGNERFQGFRLRRAHDFRVLCSGQQENNMEPTSILVFLEPPKHNRWLLKL